MSAILASVNRRFTPVQPTISPGNLSLFWDPDEDVEYIGRYTIGGFHPVHLGDVVSPPGALIADPSPRHYRIVHKLGHGAWGTVWMAEVLHEPSQCYVALKICAADVDPERELSIFRRLSQSESKVSNILQLRDSFSMQGPNGEHVVLVHDLLGSLLGVVQSTNGHKHVRMLCRQIVSGVAALHRLGIVHGDIHVGNLGVNLHTLNDHPLREIMDFFGQPECTIVLPTVQSSVPESLPRYIVTAISLIDYITKTDPNFLEGSLQAEIMDLGNGIITNERTWPSCTPAAVCAPEIIFDRVVRAASPPPTPESDIWSLACTIYELVFGPKLFFFASPNDGLLCDMARLCGEVPQEWRSYWDSRERLRGIPISQEIADANWKELLKFVKSGFEALHTDAEVAEISSLLHSMLKLDPKSRLTAEEVLRHPWFTRDF